MLFLLGALALSLIIFLIEMTEVVVGDRGGSGDVHKQSHLLYKVSLHISFYQCDDSLGFK